MLAWAVVVAVHAALFWLASKVLMPHGSPARDDEALALVWLPAAPPAPSSPPRAQPAPPPSPRAQPAVAAPRASSRAPVEAVAEPAADTTALTAVEIDRAAPPAMPAAAAAPRAPWDAPPPPAKPFARSAPVLPGQGVQRFRMRPPRSIASTVEQVGRMFGGGGPSDCAETRKNIRDLAVLGAEAVAQEIEEERRNCRN